MSRTLSAEQARSKLAYDPDTGEFTWKIKRRCSTAGAPAGSIRKDGYVQIYINGYSTVLAHRLAWLCVYGVWPTEQIDHINGNRSDNRVANLRESTQAENMQNQKKPRTNTSGYTGVSWHVTTGKWSAHIMLHKKKVHLGLFTGLEDAVLARAVAKEKYHTFHPLDRGIR